MNPFTYARATNQGTAIQAIAADQEAKFIAGGTNLIDLMKVNVEQPDQLIGVTRLELARIEGRSGGVRLGAGARNSDTANHPLVRQQA